MSWKNNFRWIIALAAFLFVSLTAVTVYFVSDAVRVAEEQRKQALAEPLEIEYRRLERDLENLEKQLVYDLPGGATMTIVSLDLNEEVYTTLYRIMCESGEADYPEEHGRQMFVGTLCLSPSQMPGGDGKITDEQFTEMISSGWSSAIYVGPSSADGLDTYLRSMKSRLNSKGIEFPDTAYFADASYSTDHDDILSSYGIKNVIHTNAEGFDLVGTDLESEIWRVGAVGWSGTKANSALNAFNSLLVSKGGLVFAVETWYGSREASTHFVPGESDSSFKNMLGVFGTSVLDDELHVSCVGDGKDNYAYYTENYKLSVEAGIPLRDEIIERMKEIEAELDKIYNS